MCSDSKTTSKEDQRERRAKESSRLSGRIRKGCVLVQARLHRFPWLSRLQQKTPFLFQAQIVKLLALLLRVQSKYLQEKCLWGNSCQQFCNSFIYYRCEHVSTAPQNVPPAPAYKNSRIDKFFIPDTTRVSGDLDGTLHSILDREKRLGSMNSLWFVHKCWVNSPGNDVCIFVFPPISCPSIIVNNLRALSTPNLAICTLFWYELASPMSDQHWLENQNSSSYLLWKMHSTVNLLHGLCVSFCYKKKRLNRDTERKKKKAW